MAISLPDLPYPKDALEPTISSKTLEFHYDKHHKAYVENANKLIEATEIENEEMETIIHKTAGDSSKIGVFNNVAQAWNHAFFWQCMKPRGGGSPTGPIADKIKEDFGSFDAFKEEMKKAGTSQFGSGWAWLILENGKLKITKTANADTPIAHGQKPLFTIDVWEHAYYLDYQNRRPDFLAAVLDNLINWDFVNINLDFVNTHLA